ncbi:erythromycin esterase family protein, partial [Novosphingobium sp. 1949]
LGEPGHGAREPLALRNRLLFALARRCGTRAIVLETGFTEARRLDRYVLGEGEDSAARRDAVLASGFTWGFGALAQNRALIRDLRAYNAAHRGDPIHLYGMDLPGGDADDGMAHTGRVLTALAAYLRAPAGAPGPGVPAPVRAV